MRILAIDDNKVVFSLLDKGMSKLGYTLDHAGDYDQAIKMIDVYADSYSAILIDVNLSGKNGIELCKEVRKKDKKVIIIFISQYKDVETKITALNAGADDYIIKPFSVLEIDARIKAINRRSPVVAEEKVKFADFSFNLSSRTLLDKNKDVVKLTPIEFRILEVLVNSINQAVSREQLINKAWNRDGDNILSNSIDVHIMSLRRKIGHNKDNNILQTVRGFGYKLNSK